MPASDFMVLVPALVAMVLMPAVGSMVLMPASRRSKAPGVLSENQALPVFASRT